MGSVGAGRAVMVRYSRQSLKLTDRKSGMSGLTKDVAHQAITKAIRLGELVRPSICEGCYKACKPHAHHDDDARPLDVAWLCTKCHIEAHRLLKQAEAEEGTAIMVEAVRAATTIVNNQRG